MPDDRYLRPNRSVDADHPAIVDWARAHGTGSTPQDVAVSLYYAIRDGFRYNPWHIHLDEDSYRASNVLERPRELGGHCIDKANLLAAAARVHGIPSRLHFANVRNHIGTARLERWLGTDLLVFHGYTELWLGDRWVAATPAFNRELCERLGVAPLEFNGAEDSLFQEYDPSAGRFMEYVTDHGSFAEVPFQAMIDEWRLHYPILFEQGLPSPLQEG